MKWDFEIRQIRELAEGGSNLQGDTIEALRAIAEQLERLGDIAVHDQIVRAKAAKAASANLT